MDSGQLGTGIITTGILLIVGYVVITRLIGLAFRLVVPVVLLLVLAGAGLFSGLLPDRGHADLNQPPGYDRRIAEDSSRLGDLRLRDIADSVVDMTRSILRGTLAFLDSTADPQPPEPLHPYSGRGPMPRDRFGEVPFDDEPQWDGPSRPRRVY
jgi:hypothetical protein